MKSLEFDQFYTVPTVARECIDTIYSLIPSSRRKLFIEPSAGSGSFSSQLSNVIAIDIDPKEKGIIKEDFLKFKKSQIPLPPNKVVTIGNPPFGWKANLAVRFFNHASEMSNTVAFIVPKTFRKKSVQDRLNLKFWLIYDKDLGSDSFTYKGKTHHTPCCFQVWVKKRNSRPLNKFIKNDRFIFAKKDDYDFAIQRVGSKAGRAVENIGAFSPRSYYFLKINFNYPVKKLVEKANKIQYPISNQTAGIKSLSKHEIMEKLLELRI